MKTGGPFPGSKSGQGLTLNIQRRKLREGWRSQGGGGGKKVVIFFIHWGVLGPRGGQTESKSFFNYDPAK